MKSLYFECETGISGDMIVASLLDLGADEAVLRKVLAGIQNEGFEIKISRVLKAGLDCCDFNVILDKEHENHDHDMAYLYGHEEIHSHGEHDHEHSHANHEHAHDHNHENHEHEHLHSHEHTHEHNHDENSNHSHENHDHDHDFEHTHGHNHDENHEHEHSHDHTHDHNHHHHHGRNLSDIEAIINRLEMTEGARRLAVKIFEILASAEAKAHNKPIEEVHFHEVGAIDSIVDIVSAAVCFDNLGIQDVIVKHMKEGQGSVRCQHGIIPVPVPAVVNIAQAYGLPLSITERQGEYITPTGAAFIAAVMTSKKLPECMTIEKVGMGAGKRDYAQPGILRTMIIEASE